MSEYRDHRGPTSSPKIDQPKTPPSNPRDRDDDDDYSEEKESEREAFFESRKSPDRQRHLREAIESQKLPVREHLEDLVETIVTAHQAGGVTLLQGATGSGKSIYSPVAVREALSRLGLRDKTVMLQPRKDAARGVAEATAAVMQANFGREVGYRTSEAKTIYSDSKVLVVTPGIFLRYLMQGQLTRDRVGALILDELHESSIEYHLALGLLKKMREDGKAPLTLLTSATLNRELIQAYFDIPNEHFRLIEGRAYPVDVEFQKTPLREDGREEMNYMEHAAKVVRDLCNSAPATDDILVFLPGMREIQNVIKMIGTISGVEVLPLHGALAPDDRDYALSNFKPPGVKRRVIVSTNMAETSLTVPGVKIVVDSCRQRSMRFDPMYGVTRVGTELTSKDQATQRAGRAGRVSAGRCIRLLPEQEYQEMQQHADAEILRANLSHTVLSLLREELDPETFPFIQPPKLGAIDASMKELKLLGAVSEEDKLTVIGRDMADSPFEPRIARAVVEARKRKCMEAGLVLAAFDRETSVFLGPRQNDIKDAPGYSERDKMQNARAKVAALQATFARGNSDILRQLNVLTHAMDNGLFAYEQRDRSPEGRRDAKRFEVWCREHYLKAEALAHIVYKLGEYARYAEVWLDRSTLGTILREADDEALGSVLLAGHPDQLIYLTSSYGLPEYSRLDANQTVNISPGSSQANNPPRFALAGHFQEGRGTHKGREITRIYAHDIHPIGLTQMQEVLPHLLSERVVSRGYDSTIDRVMEEISLTARGNCELGKVERTATGAAATGELARALARYPDLLPGLDGNPHRRERLNLFAVKSHGRVATIESLEDWYQKRLGAAERFGDLSASDRSRLVLRVEEFFSTEDQERLNQRYPDEIQVGDTRLNVQYTFTPAREKTHGVQARFQERFLRR